MLNCLDQVRLGLISPETFKRAEITRRTLNFNLSSVAVVEPVFSSAIFSIDIDLTGRYLLSGSADGSWYIHDTFNLTGEVDHKINCVSRCSSRVSHVSSINTVEWYPSDNGVFITSSSDGNLCLWDANHNTKPVDTYDLGEGVTRHQINKCNPTMIAACSSGEVNMIDIRTGTSIFKLPDTLSKAKEVCWNPVNQHQLMVGTEEGNLIEWDIRSTLTYRGYGLLEVKVARRGVRTRDFKEQVGLLQKAHNGSIASIRYAKNGMEFYSFGDDGCIRRWMSETSPISEPLVCSLKYGRKSKGHGNFQIGIADNATDTPLIFAPKGTKIAICDMKASRVSKELVGHFKNVNCFVYDENYQQGYSGANDSAIMIWSGNLVAEQTYQQEKLINPAVLSEGHGRRRHARNAATTRLINLLDEDDFEEEYEPASESD